MIKLPKAFKEKWLKALRSGEYEQGHGYLRTSANHFCCLGVAGDLHNNETWQIPDNEYAVYRTAGGGVEMLVRGDVPDNVYDALNQFYPDHGVATTITARLASMNDTRRSFAEIADWIEEHL